MPETPESAETRRWYTLDVHPYVFFISACIICTSVLLEHFPLAAVTFFLSVLVIITFFVTSSDSGSMVIDIITAGGNPDPPVLQRLFWAILEGVTAAALLVGVGLVALQTAAIITGFPFALVLLFMCYSLTKGLKEHKGPLGFMMPPYEHGTRNIRETQVLDRKAEKESRCRKTGGLTCLNQ